MSDNMAEILRQTTFAEISQEYKDFEKKFRQSKTTDDCYTPPNIYAVVLKWAAQKYGFAEENAVRPFFPGGDYERATYARDCVVVDNPPFSILSKIVRFYNARGVRYFLFAPALTLFANAERSNYIVAAASVTYANGAIVNTSFITNMGEYLIETAPDLRDLIKAADDENHRTKQLPKYNYPPSVAHAARLNWLAVHHTVYKVRREEALFIRKLDAMGRREIFGGGFLLSERAAAERAAAERAAAERAAAEQIDVLSWQLSDREKLMQRNMERQGLSRHAN